MEGQHPSKGSVGSGGNRSKGSSWAFRAMEQEHRRECCSRNRYEA